MNGEGGQSGLATELARQASERLHDIAGWVESREPGDLLTEAKDFARRKPGTFLIGAAVAGLLAGRVTRSTVAAVHEDSDSGSSVPARTYPSSDAYAAPTYATETYATETYATGGASRPAPATRPVASWTLSSSPSTCSPRDHGHRIRGAAVATS